MLAAVLNICTQELMDDSYHQMSLATPEIFLVPLVLTSHNTLDKTVIPARYN